MITVKLLGGTRRFFSSDKLEIEKEAMTVTDLLEYLKRSMPSNHPSLDINNILVAVNGVDSSALEGINTSLKDGDIISIIPVVHGGTIRKVHFRFGVDYIELVRLGKHVNDPINFLEIIRQRYPNLVIQGIRSKYIVSEEHAKKVVAISLAARKAGTLLSNKIETDILMRFAHTRQISDAINKVGLRKGRDFILILIGKKSSIAKLFREIMPMIKPFELGIGNSNFIKNEYSMTKKQLDCVISKRPLEELLAEKSAVLFH
jgi:tRNA threonylcarbamoyladenosine modification (KEOPS) complex Cgi121 subunit/molybdopterin converting factor small subunit